ncbi:histidine phosphatase family protein [Ramlibacter solisilvae]
MLAVIPSSFGFAAEAWGELARPGAIVLLRHATAPGTGDPPGFRLEDCSTQRNLDESGRAEARKLGEQFRSRKIQVGAVLTSQWCRTRETARLAFGAQQPRDEPAFNSQFGRPQGERDAQTAQALQVLKRWKGPGTLVVVTHGANIQAMTQMPAASGEGVVLRPDGQGELKVLGTIAP